MQYNLNFKDLFVNNMVTVVLINFPYFSFHQYHNQWKWSHWIEPNVTRVEFVFSLRVKKFNDWSVMMFTANVYRVLQGLYRRVPVQIQVLKVYRHSL